MKCQSCGYNNEPNATRCKKCTQPLPENIESTSIFSAGNLAQSDSAVPKTVVKKIEQEPTISISSVHQPLANPDESSTICQRPQQPAHAVTTSPASTIVMKQNMGSSICDVNFTRCAPRPHEAQKTIVKQSEQIDVAKTTIRQTVRECPHCGYSPVLGSATECPHCKKPMNNNGNETSDVKCEKESAANPKSENSQEKSSVVSGIKQQKTICRPFYRNNTVDIKTTEPAEFKLTLLPEDGEPAVTVTKQYNGNKVLLNRDNTEPDNMSITSKEQAEVVCKDGRWFLENKSETCTTYLVVKRKIELQPGDIIILGNRRFKFDI